MGCDLKVAYVVVLSRHITMLSSGAWVDHFSRNQHSDSISVREFMYNLPVIPPPVWRKKTL